MPIGPLELAIVAVILLLLFGARRLPEVGRSLGSGLREFRDGVRLVKEPVELAKEPLELTAAGANATQASDRPNGGA